MSIPSSVPRVQGIQALRESVAGGLDREERERLKQISMRFAELKIFQHDGEDDTFSGCDDAYLQSMIVYCRTGAYHPDITRRTNPPSAPPIELANQLEKDRQELERLIGKYPQGKLLPRFSDGTRHIRFDMLLHKRFYEDDPLRCITHRARANFLQLPDGGIDLQIDLTFYSDFAGSNPIQEEYIHLVINQSGNVDYAVSQKKSDLVLRPAMNDLPTIIFKKRLMTLFMEVDKVDAVDGAQEDLVDAIEHYLDFHLPCNPLSD